MSSESKNTKINIAEYIKEALSIREISLTWVCSIVIDCDCFCELHVLLFVFVICIAKSTNSADLQ